MRRAAYRQGDYTRALQIIRPMARKGYAPAQFKLGLIYVNGNGVPQDYREALNSTEIVYSPSGSKLALMNGSSLIKAFVPLPGGAEAVYNSSGLQYYRHADWLGTSRLVTTSSRTLYYSGAYAPFGENYAPLGTQDLSFTGQNQDTEPSGAGGAGGLYDFLYREHSPVQGRWLSPDPAGLAAVNPADPQSWNRYAYVGNRPLNSVDPLGLILMGCDPDDPFCGGCDPDDPFCGPPFCDPDDPLCWGPPIPPRPPGGAPPDYPSIGPGLLTELPPGLNTSPLGLNDILGFLPGLNCAGSAFVTTGLLETGTSSSSTGVPCLLMLPPLAQALNSAQPNVPPGTSCDKYPFGWARLFCEITPNDPIDNCVRGCLLDRWDTTKKTYKGGWRAAHCQCFASCGMDELNLFQWAFVCPMD